MIALATRADAAVILGTVARRAPKRDRRERMFNDQAGLCLYCQDRMVLVGTYPERATATIEHIIPKSLGGPDNDLNEVLVCTTCNFARKALSPAQLRHIADVIDELTALRGLHSSNTKGHRA